MPNLWGFVNIKVPLVFFGEDGYDGWDLHVGGSPHKGPIHGLGKKGAKPASGPSKNFSWSTTMR